MSTRRESVTQEMDDLGFAVLNAAVSSDAIRSARQTIHNNLHLMKNTRPTPSARHLAGFHQFAELMPLHDLLTENRTVIRCMEELCGVGATTIGLSDITVNRSQQWHKDLLRGKYRHHLDEARLWSPDHGGLYKVLLYLQDSSSLKVVSGSHLQPISLESDRFAVPQENDTVTTVSVKAGDVVLIDLRLTHRGSTEEVFASPTAELHPKMLLSTVFAAVDCPYTEDMRRGNKSRLEDWRKRHC